MNDLFIKSSKDLSWFFRYILVCSEIELCNSTSFPFVQSITLKGILEIGFSENSTILPFTMPLHFSQSKTNGLFRYARIYSIFSFVLDFLNIAVTSCVGKTPSSTNAKRK